MSTLSSQVGHLAGRRRRGAPERVRGVGKTGAPHGRIRSTDVEIWTAELDEQSPATVQFLQTLISADEAMRARRFFFERDRRRFIVGRGILRTLLARHLRCTPRELAFRYGSNGKPALAGEFESAPIHFNLAHSEGLALYAFTPAGEVGIDVERVRDLPDWEQIAGSSFSTRELTRLYRTPVERRAAEFFQAWTRQEAVLKALGVGFGSSGATVARIDVGDTHRASDPGREAGQDSGFCVYALQPAPGFAAALAVPPAVRWTTLHTWTARDARVDAPLSGRATRRRLEPISETEFRLP